MKRLWLLVVLVIFVAGCSGQSPSAPGGQEVANKEAEETTAPAQTKDSVTEEPTDDLTRLACATEKAKNVAGEDPQKNLEVLRLMAAGADALEAAGYACSPDELAETREEALRADQTPGIPKETPGALDAAGNPANNSPQSQDGAARNKCLEAEYEGMAIPQKTERSREINAEAKAKGVEPADVVGC